jgi:hypothetical protein
LEAQKLFSALYHFLEDGMPDEKVEKWTPERVHKELSEARNKLFVITKVLETGSLKFEDSQEWVLVIKPLLRDLKDFSDKIDAAAGEV